MLLAEPFWKRFLHAPATAAAEAAEEIENEDPEAEEAGAEDDDKGGAAEGKAADIPPDEDDAGEAEALASLEEVWKQHEISDLELPADPAELRTQISEMRRQAADSERNRQYAQLLFQQMQTQQALAQQNRPPEVKPADWSPPWGKKPEVDPSRFTNVTAEDLANDLQLKAQYQQYMDWRQNGLQNLLADPVGSLYQGFAPKIQNEVQQIVSQQLRQYQLQTEWRSFENQNREWLYDPQGNPTQLGLLFDGHFKQAIQMGFPDPIRYAERVVDSEILRLKLQDEQTAAATAEAKAKQPSNGQKKADFLREAAKRPNRSGTLPRSSRRTPAQNSKKDPWSEAKELVKDLPLEDLER